jgi:hypothetical protein
MHGDTAPLASEWSKVDQALTSCDMFRGPGIA